ncbi:hypothetical protein Mapa_014667 [Marchantia paleacea]|nr:hypothetical protein Mapa_014667 [Marchantia paleacea]
MILRIQVACGRLPLSIEVGLTFRLLSALVLYTSDTHTDNGSWGWGHTSPDPSIIFCFCSFMWVVARLQHSDVFHYLLVLTFTSSHSSIHPLVPILFIPHEPPPSRYANATRPSVPRFVGS